MGLYHIMKKMMLFIFNTIKKIFLLVGAIIFLFQLSVTHAASPENQSITLDLKNVALQDALHIVAKLMHLNMILSPSIHGMVSLHWDNVPGMEALDSLLATHQLSKWRGKNVWFVGPTDEFLKHRQETAERETVLADTAPLVTRVWQIRYAKAADIATLLSEGKNSFLSNRGHVHIATRTNILCVRDTEKKIEDIHRLIQRLDIPVKQVLIEAHIASVDSDFERELGIQFASIASHTDQPPIAELTKQPGRYGLTIAHLGNGSLLEMQLSALERSGRGELLSSPSLFTANQQTASIEAGEEIPYQESSDNGGTVVTFKKAVLSLQVTPHIMPDNKVMLELHINQDKPSKHMILGVPAINTRQIHTNILVKNGQTIVLGGIYEANKSQDEQGIPFLSKIPLVGSLFKQQNVFNNKRELLIFVTPKIIN